MSVMVGVGRGARAGVLVKNAEALETLAKVDTLIVDKTGTLTMGKPVVLSASVFEEGGFSKQGMIWLAASVEQASEHPLARAIVDAAKREGVALAPVEGFRAMPGGGAEGRVNGERVLVGSIEFLVENGVTGTTGGNLPSMGFGMDGKYSWTMVFVAVDNKFIGAITLGDWIKPTTPAALEELRRDGVDVVMVTGDQKETANFVARQLAIEKVEAAVRPPEKAAVVERLR